MPTVALSKRPRCSATSRSLTIPRWMFSVTVRFRSLNTRTTAARKIATSTPIAEYSSPPSQRNSATWAPSIGTANQRNARRLGASTPMAPIAMPPIANATNTCSV